MYRIGMCCSAWPVGSTARLQVGQSVRVVWRTGPVESAPAQCRSFWPVDDLVRHGNRVAAAVETLRSLTTLRFTAAGGGLCALSFHRTGDTDQRKHVPLTCDARTLKVELLHLPIR